MLVDAANLRRRPATHVPDVGNDSRAWLAGAQRSFSLSFRFGPGCRKRVTTVAGRTSAAYMSPSLNSTLSSTPASRARARA